MRRATPTPEVLTLVVELRPNARRVDVAADGDVVRLSVKSPPIEGRANAEAAVELARLFGVPKSRVALVRGARGRHKRFTITAPRVVPPALERYCTQKR